MSLWADLQKIVRINFLRKEAWGLGLVVIGVSLFCFFYGVFQARGEAQTFFAYIPAMFSILLALAGVLMMFMQLSSSQETMDAEPVPPPSSDIEHAVAQLSRNYELLRRQTTQGFMIASVFMGLGLLVILAGSVGKMFGFAAEGTNLTSVAGILMEVLSGTGMWIYSVNFRRLNATSDKLHETWRILAAFRRAEALPEERKADVLTELIYALIGAPGQQTRTGGKRGRGRRRHLEPEAAKAGLPVTDRGPSAMPAEK